MKKILLLSLFTITNLLCIAQTKTLPIDEETKKITYTEVVTVDGSKQADLYNRALNLCMLKQNVMTDNKAEGTYQYKSEFKVSYPAPQPGLTHQGTVSYEVTIFCKDGKYKYVITNLVHSSPKANGGKLEGSMPECGKYTLTLAGWGTIKRAAMEEMESLVARIKENMDGSAGSTLPKNTNDW